MVSRSKREYLARIEGRYRRACREGKKRILDEFCEVCGHHRKHAIRLLNQDGKKRRRKPGRPSEYGPDVVAPLEDIWKHSGYPCSTRLVEMIPLWLSAYKNGHGVLDESVREKVLSIRPRTLDKVLSDVRKKHGFRGLSGTKPGTYLKNRIPIKMSHREVHEPGLPRVISTGVSLSM